MTECANVRARSLNYTFEMALAKVLWGFISQYVTHLLWNGENLEWGEPKRHKGRERENGLNKQ